MNDPITAEVLEDLRNSINGEVAAGFLSSDQIIDFAIESLAYHVDPAAIRREATQAVAEALAAHASAQAQWPAVTDCDRLDSAFTELETLGIISRQNFSCCGTCGAQEILDEIAAATEDGNKVRGYAFYHAQDTESAAEGHGLCLNYGTEQGDEASALEVAQKVADVLGAHGLTATWDGSWSKRIAVTLDWKRRRVDAVQA